MKRLIPCLSLAFVTAACSSPPVVEKTTVPPPTHAPPRPAVKTNPTNEEATQKWLRQEIERLTGRPPEQLLQGPTSQAAPPPVAPENEAAAQGYPQQAQQPVVVDRYTVQQPAPYGYDIHGEPVYVYPSPRYRPYETPFPVNTVLGAGIGAIIGNQSHHHAAQGAWIGGAVGFLADLTRWYH